PIYPLPLHDALPISVECLAGTPVDVACEHQSRKRTPLAARVLPYSSHSHTQDREHATLSGPVSYLFSPCVSQQRKTRRKRGRLEIGRASCRERVLIVTGVQTCALPISVECLAGTPVDVACEHQSRKRTPLAARVLPYSSHSHTQDREHATLSGPVSYLFSPCVSQQRKTRRKRGRLEIGRAHV